MRKFKTKIVLGPKNTDALIKIRQYLDYHDAEYHLGTLKNDKRIRLYGNKKHVIIDYDGGIEGFGELIGDFDGELKPYIKSLNFLFAFR